MGYEGEAGGSDSAVQCAKMHRSSIMKRSEGRILTTHAGRLPNPTNIREILTARTDDPEKFDALMKGGVADMVRKQGELKNDIHS
jgi:hypothetical protein